MSVITTIIIVLLAGGLGYCVHYIPNVKEDNPIEEQCEHVIKEKTGLDIDLTPQSPEKKENNEQ